MQCKNESQACLHVLQDDLISTHAPPFRVFSIFLRLLWPSYSIVANLEQVPNGFGCDFSLREWLLHKLGPRNWAHNLHMLFRFGTALGLALIFLHAPWISFELISNSNCLVAVSLGHVFERHLGQVWHQIRLAFLPEELSVVQMLSRRPNLKALKASFRFSPCWSG